MPPLLLAATEGAAAPEAGGGNFLVSPDVGLMIWTLVAFGITLYILSRVAFPRIGEALDRRQRAIEVSMDEAARHREEAQKLLSDYRDQLAQARQQAETIVERARKAGEAHERESLEAARARRELLLEQTRRDVEAETRRALAEIRNEVATLTVLATEKVTRKVLDPDDQRRLVEEALAELDFSALASSDRS